MTFKRLSLGAASFALALATGCATTSALLGQPAPAFDLPALDGSGRVGADFKSGKITVIDFWASWCVPCRDELPALERLRVVYEPRGVTFVTVNIDEERAAASEMAGKLGVHLAVGVDAQKAVANSYKLPTMPTSFLVDSAGVIRFVHEGYRGADEQKIQAELDELLAAGSPSGRPR